MSTTPIPDWMIDYYCYIAYSACKNGSSGYLSDVDLAQLASRGLIEICDPKKHEVDPSCDVSFMMTPAGERLALQWRETEKAAQEVIAAMSQ